MFLCLIFNAMHSLPNGLPRIAKTAGASPAPKDFAKSLQNYGFFLRTMRIVRTICLGATTFPVKPVRHTFKMESAQSRHYLPKKRRTPYGLRTSGVRATCVTRTPDARSPYGRRDFHRGFAELFRRKKHFPKPVPQNGRGEPFLCIKKNVKAMKRESVIHIISRYGITSAAELTAFFMNDKRKGRLSPYPEGNCSALWTERLADRSNFYAQR